MVCNDNLLQIFITICIIAFIVFIKISLTQGHQNLVETFKMLNKFDEKLL